MNVSKGDLAYIRSARIPENNNRYVLVVEYLGHFTMIFKWKDEHWIGYGHMWIVKGCNGPLLFRNEAGRSYQIEERPMADSVLRRIAGTEISNDAEQPLESYF